MFKITFLGGADEIGASCSLLEIGGHRLLIDCGMRMNARRGEVLPSLTAVQEAGGIDAIILTHAHTDHSGALPVIHQAYPHIPVYMTAATLTLTTILLMDSLKIMQMEFEREGEIPLYPLPAVELLLSASRVAATCTPFVIFGGDIRLTFTPAGHIVGAATVLIESDDGVVLMGGDVSVTDQLTIPGMMQPPVSQPDLVVMESTYGGRQHANRALEEQRLVAHAKEVLERGGGILFPAFAVGRSQEVILILSRAMERGELPKAPIFVDGMVRTVCSAYRSYPDLLTPWLRKRIEKKGDPFYPMDGTVEPVFKPNLREKYANTRPAVFVASSGMLTGGASPYYATKLAPNSKNCIAITGYQDEESPGRRVQEVARAGGGSLRLYEQEVELKCEVGTYGLSAHADTEQLVTVLEAIEPHQIALVHGAHSARRALETALHRASLRSVYRPTLGDCLEIQSHRRRHTRPIVPPEKIRSIDEFDNFTYQTLFAIAQKLLDRDGRGRSYTIPELLFAWGVYGELDPDKIEAIATLLSTPESPFKQDKKRSFLYRLRTDSEGRLLSAKKKEAQKEVRKTNQEALLKRLEELFPPETGMYRRKVRISGPEILLYFNFPQIQAQTPRVKAAIEQFTQETSWGIKIHPQVNQVELISLLKKQLPPTWTLKKNPAIHLEQNSVSIRLAPGHSPIQSHQDFRDQFAIQTGFQLDIVPSELTPASLPHTTRAQADTSLATPFHKPPLEINQAYLLIRNAFQEHPDALRKCGQKNNSSGPYIELAFISPQLGQRYQEQIDRLQEQTGWRLCIKPTADQHYIKTWVAGIIPESWGVQKMPSFHESGGYLTIKATKPPTQEVFQQVCQEVESQTGFQLKISKKQT